MIIDGAADLPVEALGNKSPFEYGQIPNIDYLALKGKTGLMQTLYPGLPLGSIVANLGILGYNPLIYYPNGRASFEALAQGIELQENQIVFRCNLVSLFDGRLKDFTAGNIDERDARNIIENIELMDNGLKIFPSQSYRNLLIAEDVHCEPADLLCSEPHMNVGEKIEGLLIKSRSETSIEFAKKLNMFMMNSVSKIRVLNRKFRTFADMLFLWSPSTKPSIPIFREKYGIDGAIIAGIDFLRGIGIAAGMESNKIEGTTGYSDTDLQAKLTCAINSFRYNDLVFVHVNAPDEESHNKDINGKVSIIERIDRELIGPFKECLDEQYAGKYRVAILPDHYTLLKDGKHSDQAVPYLLYGKGVQPDDVRTFCENSVAQQCNTITKSYKFMEHFINY